MATYRLPMYDRLEPSTEWRGGRITESDLLTLDEAARQASRHAGEEVVIADFLRAAARGEIHLHAIVRREARTKAVRSGDGLIGNTHGLPAGTLPEGAIVLLPHIARRALANAGHASWRVLEGYEQLPETDSIFPGEGVWFDRWMLEDDEPDLETLPDDCRVRGDDVHALADAFRSSTEAKKPLTVATHTAAERQAARWSACVEAGLTMPSDTYSHLPRGVGKVAKQLGITRQALADDLNDHRERIFGS